jgi:small ligand-binding sensory domain FIST
MLRAGVGVSSDPDPRSAAEQAVGGALAGVERAEAALLFATPAHRSQMAPLLDAAMAGLGTRALVGATAHGVIGAGLEFEGGSAVSLLALSGLEAQPFLIADLARDGASAGAEIAGRLGAAPRAQDLVVLLPDPGASRAEGFLDSLRQAVGPATLVGAGAADPLSHQPLQWCGPEIESGALAGIVLRAPRAPRVGVTQACRPATALLTVTRAEQHWVLELDGRPALDVYREAVGGPLAEDLRRAAAFVLVALPRDASLPLEPGGYLVRNLAGLAVERAAFALPEPVARGDQIAFVQREPEAAREDLKRVLDQLGDRTPALGLYFNCCARGASFFGVPGLEAAYLQNALGPAPLAGMFGSCEIGPIAGRPELLTYTGVLALLDA